MTLLASQLSHPLSSFFLPFFSFLFFIFLEPFWLFLFEQVNVLGIIFWGLFYSSVEFTLFHSFFTLLFHCIVYALTLFVNSTEDRHIYRPQNLLTHCFYYYY